MSRKILFSLLALYALAVVAVDNLYAGPFTVGNLVVVQVGDAKAPGGTGNLLPVTLQEYKSTGTVVQSVDLPTADSGSNNALTINRSRNNGGLTRSVDGQFLVVGGTDAAPRTTPADPVGRTIGLIGVDGSVNTSTRFSDAFGGVTEAGIRTAVTVDGSSFWVSGDGTGDIGVRHVTAGGSSSTAITDPTTASRHLAIFDGQLYNSNGAASAVGTGLPTSGIVTSTILPGLPFGPANSPVFFDLDANIAGPDTLYVGNEDGPALLKYTFDGTTWSAAGTFSSAAVTGLLFLTGRIEDGKVAIYGTSRSTGAPSFGNSLVKLVDEGASSTFSILATADETHGFRGISFSPAVAVPEPATFALALTGLLGLLALGRRYR